MSKIRLFFCVLWAITLMVGCSHQTKIVPRDIASLRASGVEGIWFLQGTSSSRGPYNGELELRPAQDGTYDVVRIATYINTYFDGLKIQEVWTGKAVPTAETLTITYDLRQADFITQLDEKKRAPTDFTNHLAVISQFVPEDSGLKAQFSDKKVSEYSEWITTKRDLESRPIWQNLRTLQAVNSQSLAPSQQLLLKKYKATIGFEKKSIVQKYKNKTEFKNEFAQAILDPTDFEFYRHNKDIIRVTNKILDDIAITESVVRRNAYSPTLADKQRGAEAQTKDFHLNELGMVSYSQLDNKGRFQGFLADNDAVLVSGFYLASQAMRYQITSDKEALFNLRKTLNGLFTAIQIAEQTGTLPKAILTTKPNEKVFPGWKQGKEPLINVVYLDGGDQQTTQAVLHGLTWAALVLPVTEVETWNSLQSALKKLEALGDVRDVRENNAIVQGIYSIYKNDALSKDRYRQAYMASRTSLPAPVLSLYWKGHADWRTVNAAALSKISEIMLADFLQEPGLRDQLRRELITSWLPFSESNQAVLTLAVHDFAYRHGVRPANVKVTDFEKTFAEALERARWALRAIPFPKPNLNVEIDRSLDPKWTLSPTPPGFWKSSGSEDNVYQGLIDYPAFELEGFGSFFQWNNSEFNYKVSHKKEYEEPGVDYLYGYWLGRHSGFLTGQERE